MLNYSCSKSECIFLGYNTDEMLQTVCSSLYNSELRAIIQLFILNTSANLCAARILRDFHAFLKLWTFENPISLSFIFQEMQTILNFLSLISLSEIWNKKIFFSMDQLCKICDWSEQHILVTKLGILRKYRFNVWQYCNTLTYYYGTPCKSLWFNSHCSLELLVIQLFSLLC